MIHPSYKDLLEVVNAGVEDGDPAVTSRYSIVLATAKRARQIVNGSQPLVTPKCPKPLSIAVQEVWEGKVKILSDEEAAAEAEKAADAVSDLDWEAALEAAENGTDASESGSEEN